MIIEVMKEGNFAFLNETVHYTPSANFTFDPKPGINTKCYGDFTIRTVPANYAFL